MNLIATIIRFPDLTMGNASDKPSGRDRSQTLSGEEAPIIGIPHRTDPASITERGEQAAPVFKVTFVLGFQLTETDLVLYKSI